MIKSIRKIFPIEGLGCAACVLRVENALRKVEGVEAVSVSLASNTAQVDYDPGRVTPEQLRLAVQEAGYGLLIPESDREEEVEDEAERRGPGTIGSCAAACGWPFSWQPPSLSCSWMP